MGLSTFYRQIDPGACAAFGTTQWSVVLAAARCREGESREALEQLCRAYWYPLYVFARRRGYDPKESEDLTQEFICSLLQRNGLADLDPERGRFRAFLVAAFKHFLSNEYHRNRAEKRGGRATTFSLDANCAETRYQVEPTDGATPESLFQRSWAMAVLERAVERVRAEYTTSEKAELFDTLEEFLSDRRPVPHVLIARKFGISVGAVGVSIYRLRQRYREALRDEVLQTVAGPTDVDEEIRSLIAALGN